MVEKHGNTGNQNASKDKCKTSQIFIRCTPEFKAMCVKKAMARGEKLSEWVVRKLSS